MYAEYIKNFCTRYEYPEEATRVLLDALKTIEQSPEKEMFFAPINDYAKGKLFFNFHKYRSNGKNQMCDIVAKATGLHVYTVDFLYLLCLAPHLEKRYEKKGIDKQIFYDSMLDLKCKLIECKNVYDVWGTFVTGWFAGWYVMTRFAFGRLQFELVNHIWTTAWLVAPSGKRAKVRLWQKFVNMHIPSSGPLNHDEVIASYKKAYIFYKKKFPSGKVVFHVSSWLLSPDHPKMFGEGSNIVKFANDFYIFRVEDEKNNSDFWRIFNRPYDPQNPDYSGETTMQKKYAEMMKAGGHVKDGSGMFIYDGKEFYNKVEK